MKALYCIKIELRYPAIDRIEAVRTCRDIRKHANPYMFPPLPGRIAPEEVNIWVERAV